MKVGKVTAFLLVGAVAFAPVFAKKDKKADTPATTSASASSDAGEGDSTPAATVGSQTITMGDVDRAAASQLTKIRQQEYDIRKQVLQQLVNDKLIAEEAAARKVSAEELLKQEVDAKAPTVSDDEAQQYYDRMKGRMAGKTFDEVKADIVKNLGMQKQLERRTQFVNELAAKSNVRMLLDPPRATVTWQKEIPALGPADAPVTIVEYFSLGCPHCKKFHETILPQLKTEYLDTGKARLVFRDFPLDGISFGAALVTRCVNDLAYFAMVDTLFQQQETWHVQNGVTQIATIVKSAGMDQAALDACLNNQANKDKIVALQKEAADVLKVEATPTFFINDRKLSGVSDYKAFKATIDGALARAQ